MKFYPGFDIKANVDEMKFEYSSEVFGPNTEQRRLDDIRQSLADKNAEGPEILYAIAMDVGKVKDKEKIKSRNLLYGAVMYSNGQIGKEPVRSQGHIHAISKSCQSSTCEVYEIWQGEAIIYMQESGTDNAGRCFAIYGKPGDVIIVPPNWVHATINAKSEETMVFGAWCVRDYGFKYDEVRNHQGIAFFPIIGEDGIEWKRNENYSSAELIVMDAHEYPQFNITKGISIYEQFEKDPDKFLFVSNPKIAEKEWEKF